MNKDKESKKKQFITDKDAPQCCDRTRPLTFAAVDIGSNAARLLIKKVEENSEASLPLKKELLVRVPLRLGFDVFAKGEISPDKAKDIERLMKAYKQLVKIYKVDMIRLCATSAMRDAANSAEILKKIKESTGFEIEILTGEEEAKIVYNNHLERGALDLGSCLYVDVGGGSTELNLMSEGELKVSRSFDIGTIRILTGLVGPDRWQAMQNFLRLATMKYRDITIVGSGGNINKLYKLATNKNDKDDSMSVSALRAVYEKLKGLTVEQRMNKYGMREDRADVIVPAAEVFLTIADTIGAERIVVPRIGVADGIIDGMYMRTVQKH